MEPYIQNVEYGIRLSNEEQFIIWERNNYHMCKGIKNDDLADRLLFHLPKILEVGEGGQRDNFILDITIDGSNKADMSHEHLMKRILRVIKRYIDWNDYINDEDYTPQFINH